MSFFSRVAAAATVTLSIVVLAVQSTPVLAAETAGSASPTTAAPAAGAPAATVSPTVLRLPAPTPVVAEDDELQPGDTVAYPTLAAAVEAQSVPSAIDEQLRCLAASVYFESKGEPLAGQLAVAQVILNRADHGRFGGSICSVVTQPGQFSFVRGGRVPAVDTSRPAWHTALAVAKVAMADAWEGTADNALYFHARRVGTPAWGRVRVAAIGNHIFYR